MSSLNRKLNNQYAFKWKATPYTEKAEGSPTSDFSLDGNSTASRKFWIPWATSPNGVSLAVYQAACDILGFTTIVTDAATDIKSLHREVPMPYFGMSANRIVPTSPAAAGQFAMYAVKATFEGDRTQGNRQALTTQLSKTLPQVLNENLSTLNNAAESDLGDGMGAFVEMIANVTFAPLRYNIMTDAQLKQANGGSLNESCLLRYVEIDVQPAGKYQVFKGMTTLRFIGNPALARDRPAAATDPPLPLNPPTLNNDVPVLLNEADVTITWKQIPADGVPWKAIWATVGKTNDAQFGTGNVVGTLNLTWEEGTLLCLYPKLKSYRMVNGNWAYDIQYRFKHYPWGANSFFRVNIPAVPTPLINNNYQPGVKSGFGGVITDPSTYGTYDLAVLSNNHGFITGDNVSFIRASNGSSAGSWRITKFDNNVFTLDNTANQGLTSSDFVNVTHIILVMGFYPTSRSGYAALDGTAGDAIFPFADYTKLFQPE